MRGGGRKTKGRLIYKVWSKDSIKIYDAILKAIDKSTTEFNRVTEIKKVA